ncbi:rod shape-determining protein [Spiroplasma endosymbiont of Aspidapion aeneum]|uniref:rod shape-determining protein n=1 Tax=Spiroplasma endosymbiont of Aspidapion aeneum TaxID=3066276 RepID=UPI00313DBF6B
MAKKNQRNYVCFDLGSCNTRIYISGKGVIYNEPTLLVKDIKKDKITHYGKNAREVIGKLTKSQQVCYPIVGGVISDFSLLNKYLKLAIDKFLPDIRDSIITVACPSMISELEKSYLVKAIKILEPHRINVVEDGKLAIYGAGFDITSNNAYLGLDIGGGTVTAMSVVGNSIISQTSTKKGGSSFDAEITKLIKKHYNTLIGELTAEQIKVSVVSLLKENKKISVFGYDINTGMPTNIEVDGNVFNKLVVSFYERYTSLISALLEKLPKEAIIDICKTGLILTGGFSKIKGVKEYMEEFFSLPVHISHKFASDAVINGAIKYENIYELDDQT